MSNLNAHKFRAVEAAIQAKYDAAVEAIDANITHDATMVEARALVKSLQDTKQPCLCSPNMPPQEGNGFCGAIWYVAHQRLFERAAKVTPLPDVRTEVSAAWAQLRATLVANKPVA